MNSSASPSERWEDWLTFPFKDPQWPAKLGIAALLSLGTFLIVPLFFLYGYVARLMRKSAERGEPPELPAWENWGELFIDGGKLLIVRFIYSLPVILLLFVSLMVMVGGGVVGGVLSENNSSDSSQTAAVMITLISMFGGILLMFLVILIGMGFGFIMTAAVSHSVVKDDPAAAFRPREWWPILRANLGGFLLASIMIFAVNFVVTLVLQFLVFTVILSCLFPLLLAVGVAFMTFMEGALYGKAYHQAVQKLAAGQPEQKDGLLSTAESTA